MMHLKFVLTFCLLMQLLTGLSAQSSENDEKHNITNDFDNNTLTEMIDNNTNINVNDYVVRLNFYLKEETLPEFICEILNTTDTNITVDDIIQLGKIDQLSLEQINGIINYYNLTTNQVFNVDNLEEFLKFTGKSFLAFYDNLVKSLNISGPTLAATLDHLNINTGQFFQSIVLNLDDIYDILRNGSYEKTNIDSVLTIINQTPEQVFETIRTLILSEIAQLNRTYFIRTTLNDYGLNRRKFSEFWSILNVTTYDVYRVGNFKIVLDNILANLNKSLIPGTIIGVDRLVVHRKLYEKFHTIDFINKFRIEANRLEIDQFCRLITDNIVEMKLKQTTDRFIQTTKEIVKNNCSYISINNDTLIIDDVLFEFDAINRRIIAFKNFETKFQLGAPLVCSNRELYGLASEDQINSIIFDTFIEPITPNISVTLSNGSIKVNVLIPFVIIVLIEVILGF